MKWRAIIIALFAMTVISIAYGEVRYHAGWNAHSDKVNADYAKRKQAADEKLAPAEAKAAASSAEGKVIYRTITRSVVKYVQDPNRSVCKFDTDAVSLRQQAIEAANNLTGFDDPTVQASPGGQ